MKKSILYLLSMLLLVSMFSVFNFSTVSAEDAALIFAGTFELAQAVPAPAVALPDSISGSGLFYFNPEDNLLAFQVVLTDLSSSVRALQFHNGAIGEIGPPIQTICGEGPAGVIGTPLVDGPWRAGTDHVMQQRWTMTDAQVEELLAGNIYVNVHTETNFAPGEFRAQLNRQ